MISPSALPPSPLPAALLALFAGVALAVPLRAQSSDSAGSLILLRNGNVLQGVPVQEGDTIMVELGEQRSIHLPANQVLCWANDRMTLYRYRVDHRTTSDLITHLEEARWCIREGLLTVAADELRAAAVIDATDPRVGQLEASLRAAHRRLADAGLNDEELRADAVGGSAAQPPPRSEVAAENQPEAGTAEASRSSFASAAPSAPESGETDSRPALAMLSKRIVADYTSRIQPLLINRCGQAGCHGGSSRSHAFWHLELLAARPSTRMPAEMTRQNLHALMEWVAIADPQQSELLVKAGERHGGAPRPPLGHADAPAWNALHGWVVSLSDELSSAKHSQPAGPHRSSRSAVAQAIHIGPVDGSAISAVPSTNLPKGASRQPTNDHDLDPERPKRLPPVTNPFDPQVFNRLHHRVDGRAGRPR